MLTRYFSDFLLAQKPDVVHFHHTNFLGFDIPPGHQERAAGRPDPLHPSRVRCDLPQRRPDGADQDDGPLPGGIAAALPRVLPVGSPPRRSRCASPSSSPTCRSSTASSRPAPTYATAMSTGGYRPAVVVEPQAMAPVTNRLPDSEEDRSETALPTSASSTATRAPTSCSGDGAARRRLRWSPVDLRREPRDPAQGVPGGVWRRA